MKDFKVSIIVPVYNVEKYLKRCMDSLISQTFSDIEIIAVNDGSTDNSIYILEEYRKKDSRIKVIHKTNGGLSSARNEGIKIASGKYLTFVDSDDWIDISMLEDMYKQAESDNYDVVMCSYSREYSNKSRPKKFDMDLVTVYNNEDARTLHRRIIGPIGEEIRNPEHNDSLITAWGKLYKSSIIKENNIEFIDTSIIGTEDCLFNVHVFKYVNKALFLNKDYYKYWKENANSLTSVHKSNLKEKWKNMYRYIREFIDENEYDEVFYKALDNRICMSTLGLGLNECNKANKISEFNKMKNIKDILTDEIIVEAFKNFELRYFPTHWKIFYFFNKKRFALLSFYMLNTIQFLRTRI